MPSDLILLTGATGHLGFRVLMSALQAGYRVRCAIRDPSKASKVLATQSIKHLDPGANLEFVTVPDMTILGAFDEAIKGAVYAIHVASPITSAYKEGDDYEKVFIEPAVKGTLNLLEAANKADVKRVAITSSIVAIIPWAELTSGANDTVWDEKSRIASPAGPYSGVFEAYSASKTFALNEAEKWVKEKKRAFDVVPIFPSFIVGGDELVSSPTDALTGTNWTVLKPAIGQDAGPTLGASIHIEDVADAHVKALNAEVPGNQGYILSSQGLAGTKWEEVFGIVKEKFPDAVARGVLPNDGNVSSLPIQIDEGKSEKVLGMKYRGFAEQVASAVGHYLTLLP